MKPSNGHEAPDSVLRQQASLYVALAQSCSDAVIVTSPEGVISAWNPAAERMFGIPAAEMIGRPVEGLFVDSSAVGSRIRSGAPGPRFETRVLHRNGQPVTALVTLSPVPEGVLILAREPDDAERLREAGEINRLYRSAIENLSDCINIKDVNGRFLIANEATADLMQARSAADLIGRTDFDFYPRHVAEAFLQDERKILEEGVPRVVEQEAFRRDGSRVLLSTLKVPLRDGEGRPAGLITLNRDVTQNRLLERQLAQSQEHLGDALAYMPNGLAMFDASGLLVFCNQQFSALFPSASALCVPGHSLQEIFLTALAQGGFRAPPAGLAARGADLLPSLDGTEYQLADGRWIESRAKRTAGGGCLLVSIDVTARKEAAKALEESEERYRLVADVTLEAWWEENLQLGTVKHSRRFCEMLGLDDDMLECPVDLFLGLIHPDDAKSVDAAFRHALRDNADYSAEYRLRHADGHYIWVEDHGRLVARDADGNPLRLLGALTDITARKQVEIALQDSEENFRQLFDHAPDAYVIVDPDNGRILACNHATARMLRGSREDIVGKTPDDVSPPFQPDGTPSSTGTPKKIRNILESGYDRFEWMHRRLDGTDFWAEVTTTVGTFRQRRAIYGIWREIGEIIAAKQAAEAASTAKSQFLSVMSHELRTPLTAIMGMFQLIGMAGSIDKARDYVERGLGSTEHLLKLVEDILDFSSIESGRLTVVRLPFRLSTLVEEVSNVAAAMRKSDVAFRVEAQGLLRNLDVLGDALRLKQVLINLVGNALKFTDRGSVVLSVTRDGGPDDAPVITFAVTDTGIGLAPDQQGRLFQPFTQVDMTNARRFGGTGLGLVISQRLVSLMGGDPIMVESKPGAGSRFAFRLALPLVSAVPGPVAGSGSMAAAAPGGRLSGYNVLVVEDSATVRFALRLLLQSEGATVEEAEDGAVAVKMALSAARPFDALLMDMQMPVLDGLAATREMRARGYARPIVALTANAFARDMQDCLAAGMNDYVAKPVKLGDLVEVLQRNCRGLVPSGST